MITVISHQNITRHAELYLSQFRLRHQEFIERQSYNVNTLHGMEFDEYDTLASVYLVYSEDGKEALGCSRLTPTDKGCMLADHWPELVTDKSLFDAPDIWEGTRFCINSHLPAAQRQTICRQISLAYIEFGLMNGVSKIIGLMPTLILRSVFERSGISLDRLGPSQAIGAHAKIQAAAIRISGQQLEQARSKTGLSSLTRPDECFIDYFEKGRQRAA
ncbi:MAG: acyl-homoserine-lactone synthase [Asticcacaulis sp.]